MTFSLVARDAASGAFGAVICSSSPAVAARCVHLADGAGAVLSQNVTDPRLGPKLLGLLSEGADAATAIAAVVASEPFTEFRQLIALDVAGRAAVHSGRDALGVVGQYAVDGAAAAGNLLATPDVPQRLVEAWLAAKGPVETRLLSALAAAIERLRLAGHRPARRLVRRSPGRPHRTARRLASPARQLHRESAEPGGSALLRRSGRRMTDRGRLRPGRRG